MKYRIIDAPAQNTISLLRGKMTAEGRKLADQRNYGAIALFQASIPDMVYFADLGQKAGGVVAVEITGSCPQTFVSAAFLGETETVRVAMSAVLRAAGQPTE